MRFCIGGMLALLLPLPLVIVQAVNQKVPILIDSGCLQFCAPN